MLEFVRSIRDWLSGTRLIRRLRDALFFGRARRRVAELDGQSVARCQKRTLLGLVHKGQTTRFGQAHDFRRIRNRGDFQRLVPLQTPATLWQNYWQPAFPQLAGTTWPGPISFLAAPAVTSPGSWKCLPVSPLLLATHHAALCTALALAASTRPGPHRQPRFFAGRLCHVGSLAPSLPPAQADRIRGWDDAFGRQMAALFPTTLVPSLDPTGPEGIWQAATAEPARRQITWVVGAAEQLIPFFTRVRQATGCEKLAELWPNLASVLYSRNTLPANRAALQEAIGSGGVLLQETYFPAEGPVAVEDPRHDLLRLLPDEGVFFEFVPVEELARPQPARQGAAEVEPGIPYALALTSPAGLWACLTGTRVCFERRDPPLLRLLEAGDPHDQAGYSLPAGAGATAHPFPTQAPHVRTNPLSREPRPEATERPRRFSPYLFAES